MTKRNISQLLLCAILVALFPVLSIINGSPLAIEKAFLAFIVYLLGLYCVYAFIFKKTISLQGIELTPNSSVFGRGLIFLMGVCLMVWTLRDTVSG